MTGNSLAARSPIIKSDLCNKIWNSAYNTIYLANTVIEGASAATATTMRDSVRAQFIAEAKFMRAFSYFYLVNYFGEVPLALTVDFNQTAHLSRSAISKVYAQVERDLLDAYDVLPKNYRAATGEKRIRVNHWAAAAMLARLYLYTGENEKAAVMASHVIEQTSLFRLETSGGCISYHQSGSYLSIDANQRRNRDFEKCNH